MNFRIYATMAQFVVDGSGTAVEHRVQRRVFGGRAGLQATKREPGYRRHRIVIPK